MDPQQFAIESLKKTLIGHEVQFIFRGSGASSSGDHKRSVRTHDIPRVGDHVHYLGALYRVAKVLHDISVGSVGGQDEYVSYPRVLCQFESDASKGASIHFPDEPLS